MSLRPENWPLLKEVFEGARALSPDARLSYLAAACGDDERLRQEVELLLTSHQRAKSFLETPAAVLFGDPMVTKSLEGQRIGAYQLSSRIGAGGMGEVYRARDTKLNRGVAIKVLLPAVASDPDRLARFSREAQLLASLNHPNIAQIHGLEESGGVRALVMELVEGPTLADRIAKGSIPIDEALAIAEQIALALEAAHEQGIVHRDLKPANIKVRPDGRAKVLDFGLAKAVWGTEERQDFSQLTTVARLQTVVGHIVGSPPYMSPEQARGQNVDERTDIWAFGCVLYEMLTGRRAFQGEVLSDTIAAVLEREPDWKLVPSATPASIRELLRRCLDKAPTRRLQKIADARKTIERAQRRWSRWQVAASAAAVLALGTLAIGATVWSRGATRSRDRFDWVQLTMLPDSVSQPALSPDGRMLAFLRGADTFLPTGQVYVKLLPDGEPVQLTHDDSRKMSPAFSPDGSRVAYTSVDREFRWDTWVVPVLGGEPQPLLRNASGLIWTGPRQVLFSEMRKSPHMGIVAADESRIGQRDVYLPAHEYSMAHRSYASPDGKSILLVEMDPDHAFLPCRVVPASGVSTGRQVGPPGAACTFGAWSPDGKWMYLNSKAGGSYHIWRQRFPDGAPEQITSGPTEEEGIALAADGQSFVAAVAMKNSSLWLHDATGERQISLEGNAVDAKFTPDGKRLCYKVIKEVPSSRYDFTGRPGELRVADLITGRSEPLVPGFQTLDWDISADGRDVVMEVADREGTSRLWLAAFDRRSPPRQIPNAQGRQPRFGPDGDILFRRAEGSSGFVYRVHADGTGFRKAIESPIALLFAASPDGRWVMGWGPRPGGETSADQAYPLSGGPPVLVADSIGWNWSPGGNSLDISAPWIPDGRSYIIPLPAGEALPRIPAGGFRSEREVAQLPGARRLDAPTVPGPSPDVYAIDRSVTQRNLYRIPVP
jgi:Tol biopolymer transport system component